MYTGQSYVVKNYTASCMEIGGFLALAHRQMEAFGTAGRIHDMNTIPDEVSIDKKHLHKQGKNKLLGTQYYVGDRQYLLPDERMHAYR